MAKLYLPKSEPVEVLQYTDNWEEVQAFMGSCLLHSVPYNDVIVCHFKGWKCTLRATDWVVRYASQDVIIVDDASFQEAYTPVE